MGQDDATVLTALRRSVNSHVSGYLNARRGYLLIIGEVGDGCAFGDGGLLGPL